MKRKNFSTNEADLPKTSNSKVSAETVGLTLAGLNIPPESVKSFLKNYQKPTTKVQSSVLAGGLLNIDSEKLKKYREQFESEQLRAKETRLAEIDRLDAEAKWNRPGIFGSLWPDKPQAQYQRDVVRYALENSIDLSSTTWLVDAERHAGRKCIAGWAQKKPRGRPKKEPSQKGWMVGLLTEALKSTTPELDLIEKLRIGAREDGKREVTDSDLVRFWIGVSEFKGEIPNSDSDKRIFEAKVRGFQNKLSKQRSNTGRPASPRPSHK
jgi:hypothetical protein